MKVVFFGNHTVGIKSLETLLKHTNVAGVVAHPFDPEDGKNYSSVYDYALSKKLTAIRGKPKENKVFDLVKKIKPDLIWVTDYRYLLPMELISESIKGGINLHPSLLPKYRGRASLNWAILNGEKEIGLTAHFLDKEADTGDIIKQEKIFLYKNENIGDVINKILPIYSTITKDVILKFKNNNIKRTPQDNTLASYFPARKPKDGLIDWSKSAEKIFNFVRSISHPYPGAFSNTVNGRIYIWKSSIVKNKIEEKKSDTGKIVKYVKGKMFIVSCGEGFLKITDWTIIPENSLKIYVGLKFQDISSKKKLIDDNLQNINFYESLLKKYGKSYKALNWGSLENQKKRFEVIADVGLKAGDSILDVGCGLSDFYGWIRKKIPGIKYEGLDITPSMIDRSRRRFPNTIFYEGTIHDISFKDKKFDFLVASGIFYKRVNKPNEYLKKTIKKMFDLSKKGIAFNNLNSWSVKKKINNDEYYADPRDVINFCRTLTPHIVFRNDYHLKDFTIYLYHSKKILRQNIK